eukprot:CAMPEP_0206545912 /NCGR_PEP_ID=MMETSP0325_2-20121206/12404_1 /ASSEMBLY_ACC=CAM_ASM_000347 /TAXON_ID=2866 /ORGANISM="Crypthecodinium cohnii, Strain Seligo" /LENGTH=32 /DNA_ID= /DNA_START= /DNA_END= /DNA_ORIENTATION=
MAQRHNAPNNRPEVDDATALKSGGVLGDKAVS